MCWLSKKVYEKFGLAGNNYYIILCMSLMIITLRIGLVCLQMVVAGVGSLGGLGVAVTRYFPFPRPLPRRTGPGLGGSSCTVR